MKNPMIKADIKSVSVQTFGSFNTGYCTKTLDNFGLIFYVDRNGACHLVLEDGKVSQHIPREGEYRLSLGETVRILNPKDIGIVEFSWSDEEVEPFLE